MKLGIMQPYFFPYIGYWQLISAVDKFVVYDNIQFTKNSWIRRNRILANGTDILFTLPIKKDSDFLDIRERCLAESYSMEKIKLLNKIRTAYKRAPHFESVFALVEECINIDTNNLFEYIYNSIIKVSQYLNIDTEFVVSSNIDMDHSLHNKLRVLEICKVLGADVYINPIGGVGLYDKDEFAENGIDLHFIKTNNIYYKQFNNEFVPNLSIIDVMMFNSIHEIKAMLGNFAFI